MCAAGLRVYVERARGAVRLGRAADAGSGSQGRAVSWHCGGPAATYSVAIAISRERGAAALGASARPAGPTLLASHCKNLTSTEPTGPMGRMGSGPLMGLGTEYFDRT